MEAIRFYMVLLFVCIVTAQNSTERTRGRGRNQESNLMTIVQQIQLQLNSLEGEGQRHNSRLQEVLSAATRLEAQRQEFIGILDRSETHLAQKVEDVKADVRKVMTLQDILREDADKIQQNQLLAKVWMEENLQGLLRNAISYTTEGSSDSSLATNADIAKNLQLLQSTVQGIRRMADTLQSTINTVKLNVTDLSNITRLIMNYGKESLVTKTYLQAALIESVGEKVDPLTFNGWINQIPTKVDPEEKLPRDCLDAQRNVRNETGIYRIQLQYSRRPIFAFCDMETDGGGWTVIQRRQDESVDFLRLWQDYKHGFGNVAGNFWFGNENIHLLTHQDLYELRVDLEDFDGGSGFAHYDAFAVGSEKEKYMLKLLGPLKAGEIGDGLSYHASVAFSTLDVDNDHWEGGHCAMDHQGGWWYNQCDASNLNGRYLAGLNPHEYQGVYWHEWHGPSYSLKAAKMMVRPKTLGKIGLGEKDKAREKSPSVFVEDETNA